MKPSGKIFEDLSKLASDAVGTALDAGREVERIAREQAEHVLRKMHLVTKEEYDALHTMVAQMRIEQEALKARLAKIEGERGV
jgi:BMFP domain-containing protein YqiC